MNSRLSRITRRFAALRRGPVKFYRRNYRRLSPVQKHVARKFMLAKLEEVR